MLSVPPQSNRSDLKSCSPTPKNPSIPYEIKYRFYRFPSPLVYVRLGPMLKDPGPPGQLVGYAPFSRSPPTALSPGKHIFSPLRAIVPHYRSIAALHENPYGSHLSGPWPFNSGLFFFFVDPRSPIGQVADPSRLKVAFLVFFATKVSHPYGYTKSSPSQLSDHFPRYMNAFHNPRYLLMEARFH